MKATLSLPLFLFCYAMPWLAPPGRGQVKKYIHNGNALYNQQKFKEAEEDYRRSVEKSGTTTEGNFNLGDALYKQKKMDGAGQQFTKITNTASDPMVKAGAYHNLGNTLLASKKLEESVEAYKKSLINNPKDNQTRYNLAYAQELLKKQQQKNKDNKNNKQDKNDQSKPNKKDPDKNKPDSKKDKDGQDKNEPDPQSSKDGQNNPQNQRPNELSKEDAQRMLDELNNEEQHTRDQLQAKGASSSKTHISKNW